MQSALCGADRQPREAESDVPLGSADAVNLASAKPQIRRSQAEHVEDSWSLQGLTRCPPSCAALAASE